MKTEEELIWEAYIIKENSITRGSVEEVRYYIDEFFGDTYENLNFEEVRKDQFISTTGGGVDPHNHIKFDNIRFTFIYKNKYYVKVFSAPGENASKSKNGSLTVTGFVYDYDLISKAIKSKNYIKKISNAFYNPSSKQVDYDPIIRNGKDMLDFIKMGLDEDDRGDNIDTVEPTLPKMSKSIPKPKKELVGV
jgi:hypothetical protein